MEILIATHNPKKRAELARILEPLGFALVDIPLEEVEETGATFEDNARLKATAGCRTTGLPCIGDDSGLCVDALNGAPGVYSARFAGRHGDDHGNIRKLLCELEKSTSHNGKARFVCAICCAFPDESEIVVHGACEGSIAAAPQGEGGFGYDPIFLPDEVPGLTMAQLNAKQKDQISHRGRALQNLVEALKERCYD